MLATCIVQPSDSLYAASIVLIKKGDQTLRLCVDYWDLKGHYLPNRIFLLPVKTIRYD